MNDYQTVLTFLGHKKIDKFTLNVALNVANRFDSHIHMVNIKPDPVIIFPYYGDAGVTTIIPEMVSVTEKIALEKSKITHKIFQDFCTANKIKTVDFEKIKTKSAHKVTASYSEKTGIESEVMADLSKIFALTVYPCPQENKAYPSLLGLDALLIEGGASVIVVPEKFFKEVGRKVVMVWNGSLASSRALKAAKGFLKAADEILLITQEKSFETNLSVNELLKTLELDGINPQLEIIAEDLTFEGASILEKAQAFEADLLVMGAYNNTTFKRLFLGGLTKYILFNTPIPLFLSH